MQMPAVIVDEHCKAGILGEEFEILCKFLLYFKIHGLYEYSVPASSQTPFY